MTKYLPIRVESSYVKIKDGFKREFENDVFKYFSEIFRYSRKPYYASIRPWSLENFGPETTIEENEIWGNYYKIVAEGIIDISISDHYQKYCVPRIMYTDYIKSSTDLFHIYFSKLENLEEHPLYMVGYAYNKTLWHKLTNKFSHFTKECIIYNGKIVTTTKTFENEKYLEDTVKDVFLKLQLTYNQQKLDEQLKIADYLKTKIEELKRVVNNFPSKASQPTVWVNAYIENENKCNQRTKIVLSKTRMPMMDDYSSTSKELTNIEEEKYYKDLDTWEYDGPNYEFPLPDPIHPQCYCDKHEELNIKNLKETLEHLGLIVRDNT